MSSLEKHQHKIPSTLDESNKNDKRAREEQEIVTTTSSDDDAAVVVKKKSKQKPDTAAAAVVDLIDDKDEAKIGDSSSDEALARRLQQEEEEAARRRQPPPPPPSVSSNSVYGDRTNMDDDEALARRLQQEEEIAAAAAAHHVVAESFRGMPAFGQQASLSIPARHHHDNDDNVGTLARSFQSEEEASAISPLEQLLTALGSQQLGQMTAGLGGMSSSGAGMEDPRDPTTVMDDHWIWRRGPQPYCREHVLGKWLVFRHAPKANETWQKIAPAVVSGELHAAGCKISTKLSKQLHRTLTGDTRDSHVICVYTSGRRMDEVGLKLIQITKEKMFYKTDDATIRGEYSWNTGGVALKAIHWNSGRPSFEASPTVYNASMSRNQAKAASKTNKKLTRSFDRKLVSVVGLSYNNKTADKLENSSFCLVREPANSYDSNAIRVDLVSSGEKIGYIVKQEAELLAPWIDQDLVRIDSAVMDRGSKTGKSFRAALKGSTVEEAEEMLAVSFPNLFPPKRGKKKSCT